MKENILFATVLMDRNRWTAGKHPTVAVSNWFAAWAQAGFDGIELWQNHALEAMESEVTHLAAAPLPIPVFSSYVAFTSEDTALRARVAALVRRLACRAVKFNVSKNADSREREIAVAREWFAAMPGVTPLCECHPGSSVEQAADAAAAFADWPELRVIIHPFITSADALQGWFDALGPRISHCHVQSRQPDNTSVFTRLDEQRDWIAEQVGRIIRNGFAGSWSIEFTKGVATPHESPDLLVASAIKDLQTLRALLNTR